MDKYDPEKKVTLAVDEWGAWHAPLPGSNQLIRRSSSNRKAFRDAFSPRSI